jgi:hypothetical protein
MTLFAPASAAIVLASAVAASPAPAAFADPAHAKPADADADAGAATAETTTTPVGQRVRVTVRAIAATRDAQAHTRTVDEKLAPIAQDLLAFASAFNYTTYRLVEEQTFDLDWKAPAQMELPGSRSLQVAPRQLGADGRIKVHLEVLGQHPEHARRLHTDYSVPRGRAILVGGYQLDPEKPDGGTLLIAITQAVEK